MDEWSAPKLRVRILGATAVGVPGSGMTPVVGVKPRQILGMLAVRPGEPLPKEAIAEWLWDGAPPRSYLASLESYVCVLRRQLGVSSGRRTALATASRGYVLDPDLVDVDLARFQGLVRPTGAADGNLQATLAALDLVDGQLLASEPYAGWAADERSKFDDLLVRSCVSGARVALVLREHDAALRLAARALDVDPLTEAAWLVRMQALSASAQRTAALRSFTDMRQVLRRELGLEPGAEAQALYRSLLRTTPHEVGAGGEVGEVKVLLGLLRTALESVPGVRVPDDDRGLSVVAADLLGAA